MAGSHVGPAGHRFAVDDVVALTVASALHQVFMGRGDAYFSGFGEGGTPFFMRVALGTLSDGTAVARFGVEPEDPEASADELLAEHLAELAERLGGWVILDDNDEPVLDFDRAQEIKRQSRHHSLDT